MRQPAHLVVTDHVLASGLAILDAAVRHVRPAVRHVGEVVVRLAQLIVLIVLWNVQRSATRRAYRRENRLRGIGHHRYVRGKTPLAFSWDSIRLCIMTDRLDTRRSRFTRGYTLVDAH